MADSSVLLLLSYGMKPCPSMQVLFQLQFSFIYAFLFELPGKKHPDFYRFLTLFNLGGKKPKSKPTYCISMGIDLCSYRTSSVFHQKSECCFARKMHLPYKWQRWLFLMKYIFKYTGFSRTHSRDPRNCNLPTPHSHLTLLSYFFTCWSIWAICDITVLCLLWCYRVKTLCWAKKLYAMSPASCFLFRFQGKNAMLVGLD